MFYWDMHSRARFHLYMTCITHHIFDDPGKFGQGQKFNLTLTLCYPDEMYMGKIWGLHSSRYCFGLSGVTKRLQVWSQILQCLLKTDLFQLLSQTSGVVLCLKTRHFLSFSLLKTMSISIVMISAWVRTEVCPFNWNHQCIQNITLYLIVSWKMEEKT